MFFERNLWMNRCKPALWKSLLRAKRVFWAVLGGFSAVSCFVCGVDGEIRLTRLRLTRVDVIGTVWRTGIAVFGVRDAAKWCQCLRGVSMPPSGVDTWGPVVAHEAVVRTGAAAARRRA